jgi:type 1 glutamine amidotransferase
MTDKQWEQLQADYDKHVAKVTEESSTWTNKVKELFQLKFSSAELAKYDGVVFCNTTGELPLPDGSAFVNWISEGKAFIGMHAATDTLKGMPPYHQMINGSFAGHPWGANGTYSFVNHEPSHPVVSMFDSEFLWKDEIYQYNHFNPASVHVLISLDMAKSKPQAPYYVPVAWVRNVGAGRLFYTSLGHNAASWENETYQKHIVAGIRWALKLADGAANPNPEVAAQHALKSLVVTAAPSLEKDAVVLEKKAMEKAARDPQWAAKIAAEADSYRTTNNNDSKQQLLIRLIEEIER